MSDRLTQSRLNSVIGEHDARRFYEDGARRWRKPHTGRRIAPSGLDTDSMDFRGVRAAFTATHTLPSADTEEVRRSPIDPAVAKEHYDIGLQAIQAAGLLPLDDRFVAGYERWADAVVRDQTRLAERAQDMASLALNSQVS